MGTHGENALQYASSINMFRASANQLFKNIYKHDKDCLLYTSDAADE